MKTQTKKNWTTVAGTVLATVAMVGAAYASANKYEKQIVLVEKMIKDANVWASVNIYDYDGDSVILVETHGGKDEDIDRAMAVCSVGVILLHRDMDFVPDVAMADSGAREWYANPQDIINCGSDLRCIEAVWVRDE